MKTLLLSLTLFLTLAASARTENVVAGKLLSPDGCSLAGLTVCLQGADASYCSVTDVDGNYCFDSLPNGSYSLNLDSSNLESQAYLLSLAENQMLCQDLSLSPAQTPASEVLLALR